MAETRAVARMDVVKQLVGAQSITLGEVSEIGSQVQRHPVLQQHPSQSRIDAGPTPVDIRVPNESV